MFKTIVLHIILGFRGKGGNLDLWIHSISVNSSYTLLCKKSQLDLAGTND